MGDARGNNIYGDNNNETGYAPYCLFTDKPNTPGLADAWNSLYIVVTQADYIINDYAPQGLSLIHIWWSPRIHCSMIPNN